MTTEQLKGNTNISYELWKSWGNVEKQRWEKRKKDWETEWENWLYKDEGVEKNPKKEKCFEIAWYYGHSSGYEEVENYFRTLVDLIKK